MKKQISFNTFVSEKWAKQNKIFSPKHYIDDINSFIKNNKLYKQFKQGRFFIKATVEYVEITRRQKGYFGYENITINNAFVEVYGNKAFIYRNSKSYSVIKIVTGKYFKISGKEVIKKTYDKHWKIDKEKNIKAEIELKKINDEKLAKEKEENKRKLEQIKQKLSHLPINEVFEKMWNTVEIKNESRLSWSDYRENLKQQYPNEWIVLKEKFKLKQNIFV